MVDRFNFQVTASVAELVMTAWTRVELRAGSFRDQPSWAESKAESCEHFCVHSKKPDHNLVQ